MIEQAYQVGESLGLAVWTQDEAGPYPTLPYPGASWQPQAHPLRQPHEYERAGTAKLLTLFHPASGTARVQGVTSCPNAILHAWLQAELTAILDQLPPAEPSNATANRAAWEHWREGLSERVSLSADLPPLRMLLVMDNLAGHKTPDWVVWCFQHGILPLYTPLGGSWLNMAESFQGILKRRALAGYYPRTPEEIISRLETVAQAWNREPTPFEWGGQRAVRRARSRARRHKLGGSGACTRRPMRRCHTTLEKWQRASQLPH